MSSVQFWQKIWDDSTKRRWVYQLILQVDICTYKYKDSSEYPFYGGTKQDAEYVILHALGLRHYTKY